MIISEEDIKGYLTSENNVPLDELEHICLDCAHSNEYRNFPCDKIITVKFARSGYRLFCDECGKRIL